jgi:hypothetical protein
MWFPILSVLWGARSEHADAFAAEPRLADPLRTPHRFSAACAAALAGCAQSADAPPDEPERARLRRQALAWLRADLTALQELFGKEPEKSRAFVQGKMRLWRQEVDLAGVRGPALARLPEQERAAWQQLWDDVEVLFRQTAEQGK